MDEWLMVSDDWLDAGFQPRCPTDSAVMRDVDGGWECGACKHFEPLMQGPLPPEFNGPSII